MMSSGEQQPVSDSQVAVRLVAALDVCWRAIRRRHPEIPPAMLVVGAGFSARRRKLGHFAAERWRRAREDGAMPEVLIGGEGLERGAEPVFATLLHEAAHALADARDVQDTSRQGRYHNLRFKALAEELGLAVAQAPKIGWSATTLPVGTATLYREAITELEQALTVYRRAEPAADGGRRSNNNPAPATCGCPRRIRVASSVLEAGPIVCTICGESFRATS
jgi:hypothetical protein